MKHLAYYTQCYTWRIMLNITFVLLLNGKTKALGDTLSVFYY